MANHAVNNHRTALDDPNRQAWTLNELGELQSQGVSYGCGLAIEHNQLVAADFLHDDVAKDAQHGGASRLETEPGVISSTGHMHLGRFENRAHATDTARAAQHLAKTVPTKMLAVKGWFSRVFR